MRHGVPVSDALRNDLPAQVPAYLCAGPADADVRDPSPGAHAARTMAVQSSVRMCRLRYVSRMEYERSDGPTQGSAGEPPSGAPALEPAGDRGEQHVRADRRDRGRLIARRWRAEEHERLDDEHHHAEHRHPI